MSAIMQYIIYPWVWQLTERKYFLFTICSAMITHVWNSNVGRRWGTEMMTGYKKSIIKQELFQQWTTYLYWCQNCKISLTCLWCNWCEYPGNFNEVFALRGSNITIQQWNMQICAQETTVRSQGSWDWVFYSKTHLMS